MSLRLLSVAAAARTAAGNASASSGIRRCERLSAVETQERLSLLGKFHPTSHGCGAESTEECYGEILPGGYEQILQGMPPPGSPCALTPDSALYDIGSGFGRLVMYAAMRTNISHAVGIEVNACRHRGAVQGKASLESAAQRSSSSGSRSRRSSRSTGGNGHELTLLAGLGEQRRRRAALAPHAARQRRACPWAGATTHGIRSWSANARRPRAATAHRRPSSRNASRHRAAATQPGATRRKRSCSCRDIRGVRGPDARGLASRGSCERTS